MRLRALIPPQIGSVAFSSTHWKVNWRRNMSDNTGFDEIDLDHGFDKLHEECGVFAIHGHPEAANLAYLGLYALQHRGQESAGIATSDHREIRCSKSMGHVADIFTPEQIACLPGDMAIGHTRYSTAGDTVLLNAHPFLVD